MPTRKISGERVSARKPWQVSSTIAEIDVPMDRRMQLRQVLLSLLADSASSHQAYELADLLTQIDPTRAELAAARQILLSRLENDPSLEHAAELAKMIAQIHATRSELAKVRHVILGALEHKASIDTARYSIAAIISLSPEPNDLAKARRSLLGLVAGGIDLCNVDATEQMFALLNFPDEELANARRPLLELLERENRLGLARSLSLLKPTDDESAKARNVLLKKFCNPTNYVDLSLLELILRMNPEPEELAMARQTLMGWLKKEEYPSIAQRIAEKLAGMSPTEEDLVRARQMLLKLLARQKGSFAASALLHGIAALDARADDRAAARQVVLSLLVADADYDDEDTVEDVALALYRTAVTQEEKASVRRMLFDLSDVIGRHAFHTLGFALVAMEPAISDVSRSWDRPIVLLDRLFPILRNNSEISGWIKALPLLLPDPTSWEAHWYFRET
jgi:hypothetical protein